MFTEASTAKQINDISINKSSKASYFIKSLAIGKYDVEWEGMTKENDSLNEEILAGNLLELREKLRRAKVEDEQRNSTNEGLAQFSEVVRNNQHDYQVDFLRKSGEFLAAEILSIQTTNKMK